MTYTIKDNNGNTLFSIENVTPKVSFESINAELKDLIDYSNELNKSVEVFNFISDTRTMESFGYYATEGFGEKVKKVGKAIWEKIKAFFTKIIKTISNFFANIKKHFIKSEDEHRIKSEVSSFLNSNKLNNDSNKNKLNEDFNRVNISSNKTNKNILAVYNNEKLNNFIFNFDYTSKIYDKYNNKMINYINGFKLNDYTKLIEDYIYVDYNSNDEMIKSRKNIIDQQRTNIESLKERQQIGRNLINDYNNESDIKNNNDNSLDSFSKCLLKFIASDKTTLSNIERNKLNLEQMKNKFSNWKGQLDEFNRITVNFSNMNNDSYIAGVESLARVDATLIVRIITIFINYNLNLMSSCTEIYEYLK